MFEDSMMESGGQIQTKSKYWMIVSFMFWGTILAILILIPKRCRRTRCRLRSQHHPRLRLRHHPRRLRQPW
jgi:hypothetical protein